MEGGHGYGVCRKQRRSPFSHFVGLHEYGGRGNGAAVLGDAREVQGFDPGKVASCIQSGRGGQGSRIARIGQVLGFLSGVRPHDRFVVDGDGRNEPA